MRRMNSSSKQQLKLELLQSLLQSQMTLTRLLNLTASWCEQSSVSDPKLVERHIIAISRMQHTLIRAMLTLKHKPICYGNPGKPWLHAKLRQH